MEDGFGVMAEFEGDVAGIPEVVAEVLFDHVALVAEAEDELAVAVMGVGFHDVPEDGFTTDGDHGFGAELSFFAEASAFTAAEDDDFHGVDEKLGIQAARKEATAAMTASRCGAESSGKMGMLMTSEARRWAVAQSARAVSEV